MVVAPAAVDAVVEVVVVVAGAVVALADSSAVVPVIYFCINYYEIVFSLHIFFF